MLLRDGARGLLPQPHRNCALHFGPTPGSGRDRSLARKRRSAKPKRQDELSDGATASSVPDRLTALSAVALGAAFLLLTAAAFRKIWGADFWWQYATGRLVAEQGIPHQDVFSYTMSGQPWIELRWLYCLVLYHLKEMLGAGGVIVAK